MTHKTGRMLSWICATIASLFLGIWVLSGFVFFFHIGSTSLLRLDFGQVEWMRYLGPQQEIRLIMNSGSHPITAMRGWPSDWGFQTLECLNRVLPEWYPVYRSGRFRNFKVTWLHVRMPLWLPTSMFGLAAVVGLRRYRRGKPGSCVTCGYDLRGNTSGTCPECGTVTPLSYIS